MSEPAAPALFVGICMADRWQSVIDACDAHGHEGLLFSVDDGSDGLFADVNDLPRANAEHTDQIRGIEPEEPAASEDAESPTTHPHSSQDAGRPVSRNAALPAARWSAALAFSRGAGSRGAMLAIPVLKAVRSISRGSSLAVLYCINRAGRSARGPPSILPHFDIPPERRAHRRLRIRDAVCAPMDENSIWPPSWIEQELYCHQVNWPRRHC
ncbi:hypothetical protein [Cereibacter sediminicola]|uniref:hypothetical protein n=1 Tax=Cereibacter sediminicola TaxID=2584941 RepID=UPI0011A1FD2D|nr:hypothetical protein [Cereibacter sediminicola]